jgi:predicted nucleic acid-binding protein
MMRTLIDDKEVSIVDANIQGYAFDRGPSEKSRLLSATVDYPMIKAAIALVERVRISFWDGLVVSAAARAGATVLYTEDLNDGQKILGVRISNPFN